MRDADVRSRSRSYTQARDAWTSNALPHKFHLAPYMHLLRRLEPINSMHVWYSSAQECHAY